MRHLLLVCLAGCVADEAIDDESTIDSEVVGSNRLAANRLAANRLAANRLAANRLAANSLETGDLMATADGREVMSYIVSCALPTGTSVTLADADGASYTYPGWIGLAPAWETRAPTVSERRWVSACLYARTNLYGVSVQISMRNVNNPTLATTPTEVQTFNVPEAAFYGDLFAPTPTMYVCSSRRWAKTADAALESFRACARSTDGLTTECGFTFTGFCSATYTDGRPPACADEAGSFVPCTGGDISYPETITIYLSTASIAQTTPRTTSSRN